MIVDQVQFLDRHHLFIKFGSVDGGVSRSTDQNLAFFAVYNMETTDIVSLYQVLTTMEIDLHIASYLLSVLSLFYKFSTEFIGGALFLV